MSTENDSVIVRWCDEMAEIESIILDLSNDILEQLEHAARQAYVEWGPGTVPVGWIGGQVRNAMPVWLDQLIDSKGMLDPTGQVGELYARDLDFLAHQGQA
jgi:hypothetical protein